MIEGVEIFPLKRIQDERGMVMHMLKNTDPHFRAPMPLPQGVRAIRKGGFIILGPDVTG